MKAASDAGDEEPGHSSKDELTPTQEFPPPPADLEEDIELNELLRLEEQLADSPDETPADAGSQAPTEAPAVASP